MRRASSFVSLFILAICGCAAQDALYSPRLRLFLPQNIPAEGVEIRYALYGAFGAYGGFIKPDAHSLSVEIPLVFEGRSADQIRAFAWAPGCRVGKFDLKVEGLDLQESYSCEPSPSVVLNGQIRRFELLPKVGTEINVVYLVGWACEFFEFLDCMVPQFSVGTTAIGPAGTFQLELPDFAIDPACASSTMPSAFSLTLRNVKTKNPIATLSPELKNLSNPGGRLKPASEYPNPTLFIANKPK